MTYEYVCRGCGDKMQASTRGLEGAKHKCGGLWRRNWSFGITWPQSERGH